MRHPLLIPQGHKFRLSRQAAQLSFNFSLLLVFLLPPVTGLAAEPPPSLAHGKALFESQQYRAAYQEFLELLKSEPGDAESNFYLGLAAVEIQDYESAVMAFDRVLIAEPAAVQARIELAKSFYKLGAYETARKYLAETLESEAPVEIKDKIRKFMETIP